MPQRISERKCSLAEESWEHTMKTRYSAIKMGICGVVIWGGLVASAFAQSKPDEAQTRDLVPSQRSFLSTIVKYFKSADDTIHVRVSSDRFIYRIGDTMSLSVEADKNAYIYVFDQGTSGKKYLLFPNKYQRNAHVKAHTKVSIPGERAPWSITVHGPVGYEVILVVASSKPMGWEQRHDLLEQFESGSTIAEVKRSDRALVRDLVITKGNVDRGEHHLKLRIVSPG
jgi:hypothetical protein